ncbi:CHAT domain-containing protein [Fusarium keratoplasticum]|uniref:CHAT domain-containing protein n=1 Tax=Fusarium keratoplasticum TaxID=1328300 RepID=A0ACC0QU49_9HYPO|nr:CHAT domain-containing protein [Fusarium keratoplasticum]KAI8666354.1 CHAT domain-containing protein [Fusarium keratoplasticum]KAI8668054.1 CHAT domain-containing protein [Fusarium keratoplasticum]
MNISLMNDEEFSVWLEAYIGAPGPAPPDASTSSPDAARALRLDHLATHTAKRRLRRNDELGNKLNDQEIHLRLYAVDVSPLLDPELAWRLLLAADTLLERYQMRSQDMLDLELSISRLERASSLIEEGNELFPDYLVVYGRAHRCHFEVTQDLFDLGRTIQTLASFLHVVDGNPMLLQVYSNLLMDRFEISATHQDLQAAIERAEAVRNFVDAGADTQIFALSNLAECLSELSDLQIGDVDTHLDRAVMMGLEARELVQRPDCPVADVAFVYGSLSYAHYRRYLHSLRPADVQQALENGRRAVELCGNGHPDKARWTNQLGLVYIAHFHHLADRSDLENATGLFQHAIELSSERGQTRGLALSNLADALASRFDLTGETEALDIAVAKYRAAANQLNPHVVKSADNLQNLGSILISAYRRHLEDEYLDEAVDVLNRALLRYPDGHVDIGFTHSLLCEALVNKHRHVESSQQENIQSAIDHGTKSILLAGQNDPRMHRLQQTLSMAYQTKWEEGNRGEKADLEKAIEMSRKCLDATPQDSSDRARLLGWLGGLLVAQLFDNDPDADASTFTEPLSLFTEAVNLPNGSPLMRIKAAQRAVRILTNQHRWEEAKPIGLAAMQLLPRVCGRYQSLQDQQQVVSQTSGLASEVCSLLLQLGEPDEALAQLEAGRAMILGFAMDNTDEVTALQETEKGLAKEFLDIRAKLHIPSDLQGSRLGEVRLRERRAAEADLVKCLEKIRNLDGHQDFLREPPIDHLKSCTREGIVVMVNISYLRSDAIILVDSRTRVVPLSGLQPQKIVEFGVQLISGFSIVDFPVKRAIQIVSKKVPKQARQPSAGFAGWLWDNCVRPVFDELKRYGAMSSDGEPPRIWWIGSGGAAGFPFHAAASETDPDQDALSLSVSSYTPSIKALLHAKQRSDRSRALRRKIDQEELDLTIVTMETTPGNHAPLPAVREEKEVIADLTNGKWKCTHLPQPTASLALQAVATSDIVHFACHGVVDRGDPSQSHLVLEKSSKDGSTKEVDKLTVPQFLALNNLQKPWIAFLSACTTASMGTFRLGDEGLHLSGALQIAGFSHVIGSLWPVEDEVGVEVARAFYENLIGVAPDSVDDEMVASALREAVIKVRQHYPSSWTKWAAYIHSGA